MTDEDRGAPPSAFDALIRRLNSCTIERNRIANDLARARKRIDELEDQLAGYRFPFASSSR